MKSFKSTLSTLLLFILTVVPTVYGVSHVISKLAEIGNDDFLISDTGTSRDTFYPAVAYNSRDNEYLVVWRSHVPGFAFNTEIYGQLLDGSGNEIGADDFVISDMGPPNTNGYVVDYPDVVYNSVDNEYLVVWQGDDSIASNTLEEWEIFGQRLDADGNELGTDIQISDLGDNTTNYNARYPKAAYNSASNQYLVVWEGDDNVGSLVNNEREIFGQRLDADGNEVGSDDFRISDMGPDGNLNFSGELPSVAYNSTDNEFLVLWSGDDNTGTLVMNEGEVFGQRLDASGNEVGTNDFRITHAGTDGDTTRNAYFAEVAYNRVDNQYLIVYSADAPPSINNEENVYFQRMTAAGVNVGAATQVSHLEPDGDADFSANYPEVVHNPRANEYLVIWESDTTDGGLVEGELEIYGQLIDSDGTEIGDNFRISSMGPDGDADYGTDNSYQEVIYNPQANEYLVVWGSDDDTAPVVEGDYEIFGQRLSATSVSASVDSAIAYPVPFRPSQGHTSMTLTNLPEGANVRIYTTAGELVRELTSNSSGQATWDAKNDSGDKVASGVYLVLAKAGGSTKTLKVVIQR